MPAQLSKIQKACLLIIMTLWHTVCYGHAQEDIQVILTSPGGYMGFM